jgi:hypothetical protein
MRRRPMAQVVLASSCLLAAGFIFGDEPDNEKARADAALERGRTEVGAITIRAAAPGAEPFRLVPQQVLK